MHQFLPLTDFLGRTVQVETTLKTQSPQSPAPLTVVTFTVHLKMLFGYITAFSFVALTAVLLQSIVLSRTSQNELIQLHGMSVKTSTAQLNRIFKCSALRGLKQKVQVHSGNVQIPFAS